ncbi:MAG: CopG family transcriptional regulator [Gemmatimonadales bacterium]
MTYNHERRNPPPKRVAEPVQVYLDPADRERLERLAERLEATKSDVLRRGLAALESQTRRAEPPGVVVQPLPTFAGQGLQPGVDLDDTAGLLDLMDAGDAPR